MNKLMSARRRFLGICFTLVAALLAACESTDSGESKAVSAEPMANVLRVGIAPNMPPFAFVQNDQLTGLEVDFAQALGPALGKETRFVRMEWEELIPALQNNRIDILMAGMNYTPERGAIIGMSAPYLRSGQMALVLRKNASKYALPGLIGNTRTTVGAEAGTTGEYLVQSSFPYAELKTYASAEEGAMAVADGEIELLIHDAPTIYWLAGTYQNRGLMPARPVLTEDLMVWGVNRDNQVLLDAVNDVIVQWAADGTLSRIAGRWINFR